MGSYCDNSVVVPDNAISSSGNNYLYIIWLSTRAMFRNGKENATQVGEV